MQPGKPVVLGSIGATPFLGLPGNPVSIHVGFEQFVRPAIRKMRGCRFLLRPTMEARLTETINKRPGRLHFVRVRLRDEGEGGLRRRPGPRDPTSNRVWSIATASLASIARRRSLPEGSSVVVEVWRLPEVEA